MLLKIPLLSFSVKFPKLVEIVVCIQSAIIHDSVVYHSYKLGNFYMSSIEDGLIISTPKVTYSFNKYFLSLYCQVLFYII